MNAKLLFTATTLVALISSTAVLAAEPTQTTDIQAANAPLTRAQVRADTLAAIRSGALPRNDADYERLAFPAFTSTRSRADVRAETLLAARQGRIPRNEADYERIARAQESAGQPLSRAQVVAELAEARRQGLIPAGEHDVVPTQRQLEQVRLAGLRAIAENVAQAN